MDCGVKNFIMLEEKGFEKFGKNLSQNVKLSNYSWFNLGGEAEFFYKAESIAELIEFLKKLKKISKLQLWEQVLTHYLEI